MATCLTKVEAAMMRMVEAAGTDEFAIAHLEFVDAVAEETARWGEWIVPAPVFRD